MVGVAGNQSIEPDQEAWHLAPGSTLQDPASLRRDTANLSGAVAPGPSPEAALLTKFGPCPARVSVLDGLLLAARSETLKRSMVRFDPSLGFHFYDLNFCRTATSAGLRLGTWHIAVTHQSSGESMFSQAWSDSLRTYRDKWADTR